MQTLHVRLYVGSIWSESKYDSAHVSQSSPIILLTRCRAIKARYNYSYYIMKMRYFCCRFYVVIVIEISKCLYRNLKVKRRAPAYSRALRQIKGVVQGIIISGPISKRL